MCRSRLLRALLLPGLEFLLLALLPLRILLDRRRRAHIRVATLGRRRMWHGGRRGCRRS